MKTIKLYNGVEMPRKGARFLSDKVHALPLFALRIVGLAMGVYPLPQPRRVVSQRAPGLPTLGVLCHFSRCPSIGDVPVL